MNDLEIKFNELAEQWDRETGFHSNWDIKCENSNYQQIIAMGQAVVPLMLRSMAREHQHWFHALCYFTGENPVLKEHAGYIPAMVEDWLKLGIEREWVTQEEIDSCGKIPQ